MKQPLTRQQRYYMLTLAGRVAVFVFLAVYALAGSAHFDTDLDQGPSLLSPLTAVWLLLMASMARRFFPARSESLGCQKLFSERLQCTGRKPSVQEVRQADRGAFVVLFVWASANALFLLGHARGWLEDRFLICLAGFYGVCDIVCILFFCPFQAWMMHNRCCITCRIYDWDYLMLCTPLLGIRSAMTASACLLAAVLFLRWEITYRLHRERFFECGNYALRCTNCEEHLCHYKKALSSKWKRRH